MGNLGLRDSKGFAQNPQPYSKCRTDLDSKTQALDPCLPSLLEYAVVAIGESRCGVQGQGGQ